MTVNYTTNLSLGQPVTGTESGTWGDDVNNAVTSYLDIAIAGSLALTSASFTANALTLANTQGTSSATNIGATTAQYYVLRLSSLAAAVTITAPSVSKTYLVVNADATYSATVKASGQSGVSVVAGEKAIVYFNGTDYIKVASSVLSNSTGTLPVANGGTGLTAGTSGGVPYYSSTSAITSSALLTQYGIVYGGGAGAAPVSTAAGTTGQVLTATTGGAPSWATPTASGTVTSVGWTGGIVSIATATTTPAFTIAGTSGGIPYFSSSTTWATSAALVANALVIGGGAGAAPSTTTTGTGVVTALGVATNATGGFPTINGTATLTNKRTDPRVTSTTSASSLTPSIATADVYAYTALAANLTINAPTGTPVDGNKLLFRLLDNGVARTLTWNATYTAIGVTLPTTTTASKTTYVGCIYNAANTRWDVVAVSTQA